MNCYHIVYNAMGKYIFYVTSKIQPREVISKHISRHDLQNIRKELLPF